MLSPQRDRADIPAPARVLLLDGGGTIAQVWDDQQRTYRFLDERRPFEWLTEDGRRALETIADVEYAAASGCGGLGSARRLDNWSRLAEQVHRASKTYDGIVITHGSATLAYAASLLSFMLADLQKTIVFTGAQVAVRGPLGPAATDGLANLIAGTQVAAANRLRDVVVVFGGLILRGNRAHKASTFDTRAFLSPSFPELGHVDAAGISYHSVEARPEAPPLPSGSRFRTDDRVNVVVGHPALRADAFRGATDARAVVFGGYLAGLVRSDIHDELARLAQERLVVVHGTTALGEAHDMDAVRSTVEPLARDVTWARDMTFESVLTKACWCLAQTSSVEAQRAMFVTNIAGELSQGDLRGP